MVGIIYCVVRDMAVSEGGHKPIFGGILRTTTFLKDL